jgi:hypothetical protein
VIGPIRQLNDPEFLRWANLRLVLTFALMVGVLTGLFNAVVGGWDSVNVFQVVLTVVWITITFVALHLFFRPSRRKRTGS